MDKGNSKTIAVTSNVESLRNQIDEGISVHGTGGMATKIDAAEIALNAGIETWILNGLNDNFIVDAINNKSDFTRIISE